MMDRADQEIINAISAGLVKISNQSQIAAANQAATRLLGPIVIGRHYTAVFRDPVMADLIETALRDNKAGRVQIARRVNGGTVWLQATVESLMGDGALITLLDVSAERVASQSRSDFVANVSHELKTPLTAIAGMIETLQGPAAQDPAAQQEFLALMSKEASRMERLVADLLVLSQAETEDRSRYRTLDLADPIKAAAASLADMAAARETGIEIEGLDSECLVRGDPDQLRQVFNNLIENALKYGRPQSTVRVTVTAPSHLPILGRAGYRIDVIDEGDGIPNAHIARLTERFYRVDTHRSRQTGGTGLGLAIVKHIVQSHGGKLRIASTVGVGSTFSIYLPQPQPDAVS